MATDDKADLSAATLTVCNCGDAVCNRWQLSTGFFYQGSGFQPAQAQLHAQAGPLLEQLKRARDLIEADDTLLHAKEFLHDVDAVIERAEHPRYRPVKTQGANRG